MVLSGLQLVHRGSIQQNGWERACRYDPLKHRTRPEFVAGIDFLKSCDAGPGTRVLPAIGNPPNDCLGMDYR
jgi:hypothetical protein